MNNVENYKEQFLNAYKAIKRPGADELLKWLLSTDFFTAPASTKYHLSEPGGLCKHSVHVLNRLRRLYWNEYGTDDFIGLGDEVEEKLAVCALLHDVCKIGVYHERTRYYRGEDGTKQKERVYDYKDSFPYGHGEKSVYLIMKYMKLTDEEALAIRQHMGAFDVDDTRNVSNSFSTCPLAFFLHFADSYATFIDEV